MTLSININLKSEKDTLKFGSNLAKIARCGDIFALSGDLGTGKTVVARGFIKQIIGNDTNVASPTFNLVNTYESNKGTIWHFDLYRLENSNEIEELGLDEAISEGICIIEWPEKATNEIPKNRLCIFLKEGEQTGVRSVQITSHGSWKDRIVKFNKKYGEQ